jgi:capsular polysaccharide biosynthesis protein
VLLVAVAVLAALVAATAFLVARPTQYEATANVFVAPLASDDPIARGLPFIRESSDGARPVQSAVGLLDTGEAAALAAERLGGTWDRADVERAVLVTPRGQSNLLAITATDGNAETAANVANVFAQAALDARKAAIAPYVEAQVRRMEETVIGRGDAATAEEVLRRLRSVLEAGDPTLSISSPALTPTSSTAKSPGLVLAIALVAGLLVGVGGILLRSVVVPAPDR